MISRLRECTTLRALVLLWIGRHMEALIPSLSCGSPAAMVVAGTLFIENLDGKVILTALPQTGFLPHPCGRHQYRRLALPADHGDLYPGQRANGGHT